MENNIQNSKLFWEYIKRDFLWNEKKILLKSDEKLLEADKYNYSVSSRI